MAGESRESAHEIHQKPHVSIDTGSEAKKCPKLICLIYLDHIDCQDLLRGFDGIRAEYWASILLAVIGGCMPRIRLETFTDIGVLEATTEHRSRSYAIWQCHGAASLA